MKLSLSFGGFCSSITQYAKNGCSRSRTQKSLIDCRITSSLPHPSLQQNFKPMKSVLQSSSFWIKSTTTLSLASTATTSSTESSLEMTKRPFFRIYYNDIYQVQLPPSHRFPIEKYRQVRELLQTKIAELSSGEQSRVRCDFCISPLATVSELETTHCPAYIERFMKGAQTEAEVRNVGLPWSLQGVKRALSSTGGTVAAACAVVDEWIASPNTTMAPWSAQVAGGTHHAFYDRGEGFCVFSDIAVAANVLLQRYTETIRKIVIIDLDVHQGNGNAVLFADNPNVFTFSMQCSANYFSPKERSDLDIDLPIDCTDETYIVTLKHWLDRMRKEGGGKHVDLIFFQAGVDVLQYDRLGRLALTPNGVQRRNQYVFEFARDLNVPLVITMGGGYPKKEDWSPIIAAHANVYFQAHQFLSNQ
jgi:acetoin utilization deacetylase AcuC-like enzyme